MTSSVVTVISPAKINLYLEVGRVRTDGYHDLVTVFQALELHDTLTIRPASGLTVECSPDLGIPAEENLVFRAAYALGQKVGRKAAARIRVDKVIPAGAGLGGGSSNAAAALAGLAAMWGIEARDPLLVDVARSLGADVPFFLFGGTALFRGRGDEFAESYPTPDLAIALIKPADPVSTAAAYNAIDRSGPLAPGDPGSVRSACISGDPVDVVRVLRNDFLSPSSGLVPGIADALAWAAERDGVLGVGLAGSGSATFAICADSGSAAAVADAAQKQGWWAVPTRTNAKGVYMAGSRGHQ
jgi:4-diphosphocytidyl-2-C-methyl-D-erythritol kinase